jgi:hypothetical protein
MKTNKEIYREHLLNAPSVLRETVNELENIIVNLAMSGELAEINDQFEENDSLVFKYEDFRRLKDYNVNLLYEVYDFLETKRSELLNVNSLGEEGFKL